MKKIKTLLRWVLSIFSLFGVLTYAPTSIPASIVWFLLAALLIPPVETFVTSQLQIKIPVKAKVILGVILFLIAVIIAPKSQSVEQTKKSESKLQGQVAVVATSSPTPAMQSNLYKVSSVIDGDTIQVIIGSKKEMLRLIGIDTPETVDPRKPVQCFGKEASAKAKSLLYGKSVRLESDPTQGERDKYQRLLRYVFLEDGTNFNMLMISEGYAHEYTYNVPYRYQLEFKQAQKEAEGNKRGLWADETCLTSAPQPSAQASVIVSPATVGGFICAGKTTCGQMVSCAEAQFYLNSCGVSRLDGDKDGVPCESLCN
ncbi:MAG: hypothetical protein A3H17_01970 [Candidatus Levybacteria bacterium RIFCSPLOWO2_12_FULL_37_14]|nr:MAG: hypothetical protein A3H17_01970 [Candidatus Levybacteria bacterium RIFCSPLOWO2_12_FULL_37_14]